MISKPRLATVAALLAGGSIALPGFAESQTPACVPGVPVPGVCPPPEPPPPDPQPQPEPPPAVPGQPPTGPPPPPSGGGDPAPPPPPPPTTPTPPIDVGPKVPPDRFLGIMAEDVLAGDLTYRLRQLDEQTDLGIGMLRFVMSWGAVEPVPRARLWDFYDQLARHSAQKGMELLPVLVYAPDHQTRRPKKVKVVRGSYPPRRPAAFAKFAADAVRRYGPAGVFWRQNPDVPKVPIRTWQVWNEPNLPVFWRPRADAKSYARLLNQTSRAIHRADPKAEVVAAGLPQSRYGEPLVSYLRKLLAACPKRGCFDTLAVHPYDPKVRGMIKRVRDVRAILNRAGFRRAGLRITEFGWSDDGPFSPFRLTPKRQAKSLAAAMISFSSQRRALKLRGITYYNWRDNEPYAGIDFWGLHTGLLRVNGKPKPALAAFRDAAAKIRRKR